MGHEITVAFPWNMSQFHYSSRDWDRTGKKVNGSRHKKMQSIINKSLFLDLFIGNRMGRESFFRDWAATGFFFYSFVEIQLLREWDGTGVKIHSSVTH